MIRNRLKHWRFKFEMNAKEFTEFLEQPYNQYTRWENNQIQPTLFKLVEMWLKIKTEYPDTNLQDLLEL